MDSSDYLSSAAAAERLGIKTQTLYAYVSRGLITPIRRHGGKGSWFDPDDVRRLARRPRAASRQHSTVIESAITLIDGEDYYYRGRRALEMADETTFEGVGEWLWDAGPAPWMADQGWADVARSALTLARPGAPVHDRLRLAAAAIGAVDPVGAGVSRDAAIATARRLIPSIAAACCPDQAPPTVTAAAWRAVAPSTAPPPAFLDRVLVVVADHGLAASTIAARTAAAYGAGIHAVIGAALGAFSGDRHGAASVRAERMIRATLARGAAAAISAELAERGNVPGLGHPLYPHGDPRARYLLGMLRHLPQTGEMAGDPDVVDAVGAVEQLVTSRRLPPPNLDFALGALSVAYDLRPGSGEFLFALGRMAGWVAHGLEAAANPPSRPQAGYTGARPASR